MDHIKKRFKEMICPICGEMYFSKPRYDNYKEELDEYLNGEVLCNHCGWIYDLDQFENPDLKCGYNKLSLNEYKANFNNKIKANPKYDYLKENAPSPTPHKCPLCGEYTFPDILSYDICPVCGFEDDGYDSTPDVRPFDTLSFNERVTWFKNKRKENPKYRWINDNDPE